MKKKKIKEKIIIKKMNFKEYIKNNAFWFIIMIILLLIGYSWINNYNRGVQAQKCISKYNEISIVPLISCSTEKYNKTNFCVCSIRECNKIPTINALHCKINEIIFEKNNVTKQESPINEPLSDIVRNRTIRI